MMDIDIVGFDMNEGIIRVNVVRISIIIVVDWNIYSEGIIK